LEWDYEKRTVDLSMPGYIAEALHHFQHTESNRHTDAPSAWTNPDYGVRVQLTKPEDNTAPMSADQIKRLQRVVGKFLYFSRAVDPTMQHTLSILATQQTTGTQQTMTALLHFLNYCASHPDAKLRYKASDMNRKRRSLPH
jgi:hypothetical protein